MFECYALLMGTAVGKRESLHDGFEIILQGMLFTVVVVSSVLVTQDMLQGARKMLHTKSEILLTYVRT